MKKAFTLLEILIVTAILGAVAIYSLKNYLNISVLNSTVKSTKIKSNLTLITSMIIKCKEDSGIFPKNIDNSEADENLLRDLECKADIVYKLDGGKLGFIPVLDNGFSDWNATESGGSFLISTSAQKDSLESEILEGLVSSYSQNQVNFDTNTSSSINIFNFYIYK